MKNKLSTNYKYCLIAKINGLAMEVKKARVASLQSETELTRNALADRKKFIGSDARHHLLAYAYLRGMPYAVVEKKHLPEKKPDAETILYIILCHAYKYEIKKGTFTLEKVEKWLKGETMVEKRYSHEI